MYRHGQNVRLYSVIAVAVKWRGKLRILQLEIFLNSCSTVNCFKLNDGETLYSECIKQPKITKREVVKSQLLKQDKHFITLTTINVSVKYL